MSKPKFTPGPWEIETSLYPNGKGYYYIKAKEKYIGGNVIMFQGVTELPNARLIKVAPKLYEFAKFFTSFAGQLYLRMIGDAGNAIYDEAIALVKEVEGDDKDE